MGNRYTRRTIKENTEDTYKDLMESRGRKIIAQYMTPTIYHPLEEDFEDLETVKHIWKVGDRFYKLSVQYYGDPSFWWIIAIFNQKPTESDLKIGDEVFIPLPLGKAYKVVSEERVE